MFAFLKPYTLYIAGGIAAIVIGAFGWLWVDNALTHSALRDAQGDLKIAEQTIKAQERAIAAVDRVDALERNINNMIRASERRIMEAEGANNEIPPEVAAAWAAGDNGLRAQWRGNSGTAEGLRNP